MKLAAGRKIGGARRLGVDMVDAAHLSAALLPFGIGNRFSPPLTGEVNGNGSLEVQMQLTLGEPIDKGSGLGGIHCQERSG